MKTRTPPLQPSLQPSNNDHQKNQWKRKPKEVSCFSIPRFLFKKKKTVSSKICLKRITPKKGETAPSTQEQTSITSKSKAIVDHVKHELGQEKPNEAILRNCLKAAEVMTKIIQQNNTLTQHAPEYHRMQVCILKIQGYFHQLSAEKVVFGQNNAYSHKQLAVQATFGYVTELKKVKNPTKELQNAEAFLADRQKKLEHFLDPNNNTILTLQETKNILGPTKLEDEEAKRTLQSHVNEVLEKGANANIDLATPLFSEDLFMQALLEGIGEDKKNLRTRFLDHKARAANTTSGSWNEKSHTFPAPWSSNTSVNVTNTITPIGAHANAENDGLLKNLGEGTLDKDFFIKAYENKKGRSSIGITEYKNAVNLATTEMSFTNPKNGNTVEFSALRHGTHGAYGFTVEQILNMRPEDAQAAITDLLLNTKNPNFPLNKEIQDRFKKLLIDNPNYLETFLTQTNIEPWIDEGKHSVIEKYSTQRNKFLEIKKNYKANTITKKAYLAAKKDHKALMTPYHHQVTLPNHHKMTVQEILSPITQKSLRDDVYSTSSSKKRTAARELLVETIFKALNDDEKSTEVSKALAQSLQISMDGNVAKLLRLQATLNREREATTVGIAQKSTEILARQKAGLPIIIDTISLLTPDKIRKNVSTNERRMLSDQIEAKRLLEQEIKDGTFKIALKEGDKNIEINKIELRQMNYGVNIGALLAGDVLGSVFGNVFSGLTGWKRADKHNKEVLTKLFGPLDGNFAGGEVSAELERLEEMQANNEGNKEEIEAKTYQLYDLREKIKALYDSKAYREQGENPYKMACLVGALSNVLGHVLTFHCKSGKNRTSDFDSEIKFLFYYQSVYGHFPDYTRPADEATKKLRTLFYLSLPNLEVQRDNTGTSGNKVSSSALFGGFVNFGKFENSVTKIFKGLSSNVVS